MFPTNRGTIEANFIYKIGTSLEQISLTSWDAQWYLFIADNGYISTPQTNEEKKAYAYFPLYPFLIHTISYVTHNPINAGLTINLIAAAFASLYLYQISSLVDKTLEPLDTVIFWLVNPAIIFFLSIYNESLFFALSTAALYYWMKHKFPLALVLAIIATWTRYQGVLLIVPFMLFILNETQLLSHLSLRRLSRKKVAVMFSTLCIPLSLLILYKFGANQFQNQNFYQIVQQGFGRSQISLEALKRIVDLVWHFNDLPVHTFWNSKIDIIYLFFYGLMCFYQLRRTPGFLAVYSLCIGFVPLLTGSTMSYLRYIALCPGLYLALNQLTKNHPHAKQLLYSSMIVIATLFALLHTHWYWIA
jgi:Gpi18-like mannosyltransferase